MKTVNIKILKITSKETFIFQIRIEKSMMKCMK